MPDPPFHFRGFHRPHYTIVPDDLFDELLPELTEAELKVLLYIIRRTFGFKKDSDTISLKQLVEGIKTTEGRVLDRGTGVAKSTATQAVQRLVAKGIITAKKTAPKKRVINRPPMSFVSLMTPVFRGETRGGSYDRTGPLPTVEQGGVLPQNPQETVNNMTVNNNISPDWKTELAETMTASNYQRWVAPLELVELVNNHAVLSAPDAGTADYARTRLADTLARALNVERIEIQTVKGNGL